jgi:hypothetical protein
MGLLDVRHSGNEQRECVSRMAQIVSDAEMNYNTTIIVFMSDDAEGLNIESIPIEHRRTRSGACLPG